MIGAIDNRRSWLLSEGCMAVQQSAWYVPLLVGLVGLLGVVAGSMITRQTEQQKWLRDERLQAYSRFLAAVNHMFEYSFIHWDRSLDRLGGEWLPLFREASAAGDLVALVSSQSVGRAAKAFRDALISRTSKPLESVQARDAYYKRVDKARGEFVEAVRVEFGLAADRSLGFPLEGASGADTLDFR